MTAEKIIYTRKPYRIYCVNNNTYYDSARAAAAALNINSTSISKNINGRRKNAGGYMFVKAPYILTPDQIEELREILFTDMGL